MSDLNLNLDDLVEAVVKAIVSVRQTQNLEDALTIRDELNRLPNSLVTEVLNDVILHLLKIDPNLCRWFILDVFLQNANSEGKADVAERINLLIANFDTEKIQ
jgi:hypothetical protein